MTATDKKLLIIRIKIKQLCYITAIFVIVLIIYLHSDAYYSQLEQNYDQVLKSHIAKLQEEHLNKEAQRVWKMFHKTYIGININDAIALIEEMQEAHDFELLNYEIAEKKSRYNNDVTIDHTKIMIHIIACDERAVFDFLVDIINTLYGAMKIENLEIVHTDNKIQFNTTILWENIQQ